MGKDPRKKAKLDKASPATSHGTLSSIPRMPTVLSPEELTDRSLRGELPRRRTREHTAARPLSQVPGTYKLPSIAEPSYPEPKRRSRKYPRERSGGWRDWDDWDEYDRDENDLDGYPGGGIGVELEPVRDLVPVPAYPMVAVSPDSVPDLAAYRLSVAAPRPRLRINTQRLIERARSPWSITRTTVALLTMVVALFATIGGMGEPSQALMASIFANVKAGAVSGYTPADRVVAETQMTCPKCYDNNAQFQAWDNAACSAAAASEVLTAWTVQGATIGKLIDTMGPDISLNGGLLRTTGFQRGVAPFGYQADISTHLTYNQMVYITHTLGFPIIVNVRISYGYFQFFSGGHFLVMTDGDSQGLKIVDSSEYYIKYLPRDVFYSMFTGITVIIVPKGTPYTVPNI